jgi:hypothetical protein
VDRAENLSADGCGCIVDEAYMTPRSCTCGRLFAQDSNYSGLVTQDELLGLANDWITYHLSAKGSPEREATAWATDLYELEYHDPETL